MGSESLQEIEPIGNKCSLEDEEAIGPHPVGFSEFEGLECFGHIKEKP